jgi:hypothetical protein
MDDAGCMPYSFSFHTTEPTSIYIQLHIYVCNFDCVYKNCITCICMYLLAPHYSPSLVYEGRDDVYNALHNKRVSQSDNS